MSRYLSAVTSTTHEQTITRGDRARMVVLAKGVFDIFLAVGIIFLPIAVYDGPVPALVSKLTGLQFIYRDADPGGAFAIASIVMGCGIASLAAGMSKDEGAYKTIATMNGVFAYVAFLGCLFSPKKFGSSILLLAALEATAWFFGILAAGNYTIGETVGLKNAVERMQKKKHQFEEHLEHSREHAREREKGHRGEKSGGETEGREKHGGERQDYNSTGGNRGGQERLYGEFGGHRGTQERQ